MFILNNNGASLYTRAHKSIQSIPAQEVCVVYLGGDGIDNTDKASKLSDIVANEMLLDMNDIPNVSNYVYVYDKSDQSKQRDFQFEHHNKNIFLNNSDIQNLYVTDKNINRIFRTKVTPLISNGNLDINFIIDGNNEKLKNRIKTKLQNFDTKIAINLSKRIFTYEQFLKSSPYLDELFATTILPRISDKTGKRLPTDAAMRNMRKMNFIAHCHGGYVAIMLAEMMKNKMLKMGYDANEIKQIQSQMLVVALNPACPLGVTDIRMISFISAYDMSVPRAQNWIEMYLDNKIATDIDQEWNLKSGFLSGKNGDVFYVKNRFNLFEGNVTYDEHANMHYYHEKLTDDGRMLMMLMRNVTMSGIRNSYEQKDKFTPLPKLDKLILDGKNNTEIKAQFANMKKQGRALMSSIYKFAIARVKKMRADTSVPCTTKQKISTR